MNRTQKVTWFNLAGGLLCIAIVIWLTVELLVFGRLPTKGIYWFWLLLGYCLFVGTSFIFLRKKQSPNEPDFDERDDLIKKRAVMVSFVSVWILLAAACIIPRFIVGETGTIPVYMLTFINLGVFFAAMLVYNVAILIQYGRGGKDGEK